MSCKMAQFLVALAIFCGVGVNLSEGVSVQVTVSGAISSQPELSLDSIESLAASRILMDHTSSLSSSPSQQPLLPPSSASNRLKVIGVLPPSTKVLKPSKGMAVMSVPVTLKKNRTNTGSKIVEENEDVRSPLHVAQCRATCLGKFALSTPTSTVPSKAAQEYAATTSRSKLIAEEMRLLPNLLRLRRSFDNTPTKPSTCLQHSPECLSCWKSCQLLEISSSSSSTASQTESKPEAVFPSDFAAVTSPPTPTSDSDAEAGKGKQPTLACSNNNGNGKRCTEGCQIACSFYENLLAKTADISITGSSSEPVIATKHENVVQIIPGKITWPMATAEGPVVYVVIQEYPDRKWRQIAQTTELELDIPAELTGAMKAKLRSVRVLVVGPEGLRSVYSPSEDNANKVSVEKLGKSVVVASNEEASTSTTTTEEVPATTFETSDSESDVTQVSPEKSGTMPAAPESLSTDISSTTASTTTSTLVPFELRLVSLIHQKSLVIAELRWDDVGGNPNQEYLITWELTGGGLKGHLVTDSTSVTLSLWPDTTYQIQVAQFHQNLDSDGEQPAENSESSTFVKSLPLIVDTSVASFPLHPPSALLSSKSSDEEDEAEADSYPHDQDEFSADETGEEEEDDQLAGHKSIGQILCVALVSVVLVLVLLTLVAFAWIKLRVLSFRKSCVKVDDESDSETGNNGGCFSACFNGCVGDEKDVRLLVSQDEGGQSPIYSSPLHSVLSRSYGNKSTKNGSTLECSFAQSSQHSMHGQQDDQTVAVVQVPVAVISGDASSSLPTSCYLSSGYYNSVFDYCPNNYSDPFAAAASSEWLAPVDQYSAAARH